MHRKRSPAEAELLHQKKITAITFSADRSGRASAPVGLADPVDRAAVTAGPGAVRPVADHPADRAVAGHPVAGRASGSDYSAAAVGRASGSAVAGSDCWAGS